MFYPHPPYGLNFYKKKIWTPPIALSNFVITKNFFIKKHIWSSFTVFFNVLILFNTVFFYLKLKFKLKIDPKTSTLKNLEKIFNNLLATLVRATTRNLFPANWKKSVNIFSKEFVGGSDNSCGNYGWEGKL